MTADLETVDLSARDLGEPSHRCHVLRFESCRSVPEMVSKNEPFTCVPHALTLLTSASRAFAVAPHVEDPYRLRCHGRQCARDAYQLAASLAGASVQLDGLLVARHDFGLLWLEVMRDSQ